MARFEDTGSASFFGEWLYSEAVPADHLLRRLEEVIDWHTFTSLLLPLYEGRGEEGRPPYNPVVLLKMLVLAYLYNLSERRVEGYVNDSLSAKWFLGLGANRKAPDHSTLTDFKQRIEDGGGEECLRGVLEEIVRQVLRAGVEFGSIQVLDSTHTVANVNTEKERQRREGGGGPRDDGAGLIVKGTRQVRNEQGEVVEEKVPGCPGYKTHVSLNAATELITSIVATSGDAHDGKRLGRLVWQDRRQGLPVTTYAGDRGYDDGDNHALLEKLGLHSALRLKRNRTEKKDDSKAVWFELLATPEYQAGQRERYKVERKFGEAKAWHGLGRCRYVGWQRYQIQAYLTAIVLNLKRIVKLLTSGPSPARALAAA